MKKTLSILIAGLLACSTVAGASAATMEATKPETTVIESKATEEETPNGSYETEDNIDANSSYNVNLSENEDSLYICDKNAEGDGYDSENFITYDEIMANMQNNIK